MDSWELDDGTLSLTSPLSVLVDRKPYTTSEDKKGHDAFLGAKFPKTFYRWVTELKETPGSPYRTNADVVRDSIYLGLQILSLRSKQSSSWKVQAAITQQEARIFQHTRIYRDVEAVVEQLEILSRNGDDKQTLVHLFAAHPEGSKYASVLKEKLLASRRLKGLLEQLEEELGENLG